MMRLFPYRNAESYLFDGLLRLDSTRLHRFRLIHTYFFVNLSLGMVAIAVFIWGFFTSYIKALTLVDQEGTDNTRNVTALELILFGLTLMVIAGIYHCALVTKLLEFKQLVRAQTTIIMLGLLCTIIVGVPYELSALYILSPIINYLFFGFSYWLVTFSSIASFPLVFISLCNDIRFHSSIHTKISFSLGMVMSLTSVFMIDHMFSLWHELHVDTTKDKNDQKIRQSPDSLDDFKSKFLRYVFHEVRVPLNVVALGLKLTKNSISDNYVESKSKTLEPPNIETEKDLMDNMNEMMESIDKISRILDTVLELEMVSSTNFELKKEPILIKEVVDAICLKFADTIKNRHLILKCTIGPLIPKEVIGDVSTLKTCMIHFLSNAIKFSPREGSEITLCVHSVQQANKSDNSILIRFSVIDEGVGIAVEHQPLIFQEYLQVPKLEDYVHSTGLGLNLCKRIIELSGGFTGFYSEGNNKGSTFYCDIPFMNVVNPQDPHSDNQHDQVAHNTPHRHNNSHRLPNSQRNEFNSTIVSNSSFPTTTTTTTTTTDFIVPAHYCPLTQYYHGRHYHSGASGDNECVASGDNECVASGDNECVASGSSSVKSVNDTFLADDEIPLLGSSPMTSNKSSYYHDYYYESVMNTSFTTSKLLENLPRVNETIIVPRECSHTNIKDCVPNDISILVVDDSLATRKLMVKCLSKLGVKSTIDTSHHGQHALSLVLGHHNVDTVTSTYIDTNKNCSMIPPSSDSPCCSVPSNLCNAASASNSSDYDTYHSDVIVNNNNNNIGSKKKEIPLGKGGGRRNYDLILMDYSMPVMDGDICIIKLRQCGVSSVIGGVTGNTLVEDRNRMVEAGANATISKPIKMKELVQLVCLASRTKQMRMANNLLHPEQEIQIRSNLSNAYPPRRCNSVNQ